ncbi:PAS domain S-box protein [Thermodesulfobacteriota bacterium]
METNKTSQLNTEFPNIKEFLEHVFDNALMAIVIADNDTIIKGVNSEFTKIFGYSADEAIGKRIAELIIPGTVKNQVSNVKSKIEAGDRVEYESVRCTKNGRIIPVHARVSPIIVDGVKVGGFSFYTDISERKKAQEELFNARKELEAKVILRTSELSESEEKYRTTIESSNDGIAILQDDKHIYANSSFAQIYGYESPEEVIEKVSSDLIHPDDISYVTQRGLRRLRGEIGSERYEHKGIKKDGEAIFVEVSVTKITHKKRPATLIFTRDITDRKKMEEELLRAQKLESVGVLAGGIAHDFNNILTTILGNVSLARMKVTPDNELFDLLGEVETASAKAQMLTKQLLTFAKGGVPVKEIALIKDIIKESATFVLRGSKSICEFLIAEDLWPMEIDVGQISQVINNIVINANQAMPNGGTIQVAAENLIIEDRHGLPVKLGRYIRISITDQGAGIREKHLLNIFDPYFTTKQKGSGLGLASSYSIIKKHDGHITVESRLGIGTTFQIYLPASEKTVPEKEEVKLIKGQGRILVMDDEAPLKKMIGRMLKNLGYESEFAQDGAEVIRMFKEAKKAGKPYDAVILDLTIPGGMGGKESIDELLKIDPEIKAIVSSGYSDDPVLSNFQDYGFKGMMPKPFESHLLSKVLHEVLKCEND